MASRFFMLLKNQEKLTDTAVTFLRVVRNQIFQSVKEFKNFEINLYFVCLPAIGPTSTIKAYGSSFFTQIM